MAPVEDECASRMSIPAPELSSGIVRPYTAPGRAQGQKRQLNGPGDAHPSGKESHGRLMQVLRGLAFAIYMMACCTTIAVTQLIGAPLYLINRELYYAYMSMTKRSFAITTSIGTYIWGPTVIRISGDESVSGEIHPTPEGGVRFGFPERIILIANHQIYTDWLYLWWVAYANAPAMHGHVYIILKESLKHIPIIGWGMRFYSFIFLSRKMATDRPRLSYRLQKLRKIKTDPNGGRYFDPMWLLLFPEGTNLTQNGRNKSVKWAEKNNLRDPEHVMLPRSTGTFFCLNELKGSVDYVYDCTVAYEGVPRGKYGEDYFGLASTYFQGRPPKSVNFYWRRFRVSDIPLNDAEAFDRWLRDQWYKKDALIEEYLTTGRFPAMAGAKDDSLAYVEAPVRTRHLFEIFQVFTVVSLAALLWNNVRKFLL